MSCSMPPHRALGFLYGTKTAGSPRPQAVEQGGMWGIPQESPTPLIKLVAGDDRSILRLCAMCDSCVRARNAIATTDHETGARLSSTLWPGDHSPDFPQTSPANACAINYPHGLANSELLRRDVRYQGFCELELNYRSWPERSPAMCH